MSWACGSGGRDFSVGLVGRGLFAGLVFGGDLLGGVGRRLIVRGLVRRFCLSAEDVLDAAAERGGEIAGQLGPVPTLAPLLLPGGVELLESHLQRGLRLLKFHLRLVDHVLCVNKVGGDGLLVDLLATRVDRLEDRGRVLDGGHDRAEEVKSGDLRLGDQEEVSGPQHVRRRVSFLVLPRLYHRRDVDEIPIRGIDSHLSSRLVFDGRRLERQADEARALVLPGMGADRAHPGAIGLLDEQSHRESDGTARLDAGFGAGLMDGVSVEACHLLRHRRRHRLPAPGLPVDAEAVEAVQPRALLIRNGLVEVADGGLEGRLVHRVHRAANELDVSVVDGAADALVGRPDGDHLRPDVQGDPRGEDDPLQKGLPVVSESEVTVDVPSGQDPSGGGFGRVLVGGLLVVHGTFSSARLV